MAEVGFATIPNQLHEISLEQGAEFNVMVAGCSGLGKSTLLNSLFATELYTEKEYFSPDQIAVIPPTVQVQRTCVTLEERGVQLRLTLIDTPGFGDSVNNANCWSELVAEIDRGYEQYMNDESRLRRTRLTDARIHCLLYFVSPHARGLRALDIAALQSLQHKVNVVLLIGKADGLTESESGALKAQILADLTAHNLTELYRFPLQSDESLTPVSRAHLESSIFAVCGSPVVQATKDSAPRVRVYPWGTIEVGNERHCDFTRLRDQLIRTHLQDLLEQTHFVHYERYRTHRLGEVTTAPAAADSPEKSPTASPMEQFQALKEQHERKLEKMQADMAAMFDAKAREKERKLRDVEVAMQRRYDELTRSLQASPCMLRAACVCGGVHNPAVHALALPCARADGEQTEARALETRRAEFDEEKRRAAAAAAEPHAGDASTLTKKKGKLFG